MPQAFNRQAGHAPHGKTVVAQLKTAVSAQSLKRPVAPSAYRPQTTPNAAQPKMANAVNQKPAGAPPIYRPQPVPKVLQTKRSPVQGSHVGQPQMRLVQRQAAARGVVQRVPCDICGGTQVATSDGINTYNGHEFNCPRYVRTYQTAQDRANGLTRSGSFRNLEQVGGGLGPTGLYTQPIYGYVRRHFHDNTALVGGQFVVH